MPQEYSPKDHLMKMLHLWWLLVICILLGGLGGYAFHHLKQPVYQSKATLYASIDYQKITDVRLSEYDEDMTINSVQSVMLSNAVLESVILEAEQYGYELDYATFIKNMDISRKFTDYELFYRDTDPEKARVIVNIWTDAGIQSYRELQKTGSLPIYVTVNPGSLADLPSTPLQEGISIHVLAGIILGTIAGILLTSLQRTASGSNIKTNR